MNELDRLVRGVRDILEAKKAMELGGPRKCEVCGTTELFGPCGVLMIPRRYGGYDGLISFACGFTYSLNKDTGVWVDFNYENQLDCLLVIEKREHEKTKELLRRAMLKNEVLMDTEVKE